MTSPAAADLGPSRKLGEVVTRFAPANPVTEERPSGEPLPHRGGSRFRVLNEIPMFLHAPRDEYLPSPPKATHRITRISLLERVRSITNPNTIRSDRHIDVKITAHVLEGRLRP